MAATCESHLMRVMLHAPCPGPCQFKLKLFGGSAMEALCQSLMLCD